jgi:hypothetical protein
MHTSPHINDINKKLAEVYDKTLDGRPIFRVVWSNDQFEVRNGTFNEFYGRIFLRTVTGARVVRKYSYIQERWILEKWFPIEPTHELPSPDGYEIIYLFEDKNGNALPVIWPALELICHVALNPMDSIHIKQALDETQQKKDSAEVAYFEDMFDSSALQSRFHFDEAILLPGKDF